MKTAFTPVAVGVLLIASTPLAHAADWILRATGSGICTVQEATSSSLGGELFRDKSRKKVCEEALKRYEAATEQSGKCGAFNGIAINNCKPEKVTLPK